jgi:SagB-type dehydrogenase family enzyme
MEDFRRALAAAAADQDCVGEAPLDIVVAGVLERTAVKYGERAEQYILLEAGHAAQNILLEATALGLGGVAIGAMDEGQLAELLGLPEEEAPLYVLALGHPR